MAQTRDRNKTTSDPWIGRTLAGRYKVDELIGEGGMGRVYRGHQQLLDRPVAIKRVHSHLSACPEIASRFMTEARLASKLAHPNIVRIVDFGRSPDVDGGDLYLVMELLEGRDLGTILANVRTVPLVWGIEVLLQALAALAEAHAQGITHYDIKPENLILTRRRAGLERVKVIDFGVARANGADAVSGGLVGTPHYMSPEQVRGDDASVSADLYAIGAILFQMLTGTVLFAKDTAREILQCQLEAERPDPRKVAPQRNIPRFLAEICSRAIAIDRRERFQSAEAFSEVLQSALSLLKTDSPPSERGIETLPPSASQSPTNPTAPDLPWAVRPSTAPRSDRYRLVFRGHRSKGGGGGTRAARPSYVTEVLAVPKRLARIR